MNQEQISKVKESIQALSREQDLLFEQLIGEQKISRRVEDILFDYLYNDGSDRTFEEYLAPFGYSLKDVTHEI